MRPVFRKDVTGDLVFRPPEGPPTSGNVTLKEADGTVLRADVVATTPVVDTTITAEAKVGAYKVVASSMVGVAKGRDLWIGDDEEARDNVVVEEFDSATNEIFFRTPLEFNQPNGMKLVSGELSVTLLAGEVDVEEENRQAWWDYVVDGKTYYAEQLWDVVPRLFRIIMPPARLRRYVSRQLLEQSDQTRDELLEQAEWIVTQWLRLHGVRPEWVMDATEMERFAGLTVVMILLYQEVQYALQRERLINIMQEVWQQEWRTLWKVRPRWLDRDLAGDVDVGETPELVEELGVGMPDFTSVV